MIKEQISHFTPILRSISFTVRIPTSKILRWEYFQYDYINILILDE